MKEEGKEERREEKERRKEEGKKDKERREGEEGRKGGKEGEKKGRGEEEMEKGAKEWRMEGGTKGGNFCTNQNTPGAPPVMQSLPRTHPKKKVTWATQETCREP